MEIAYVKYLSRGYPHTDFSPRIQLSHRTCLDAYKEETMRKSKQFYCKTGKCY